MEFYLGWWDRIRPEILRQRNAGELWPIYIDLEKLEIHPSGIEIDEWKFDLVNKAYGYYYEKEPPDTEFPTDY